MVTCSRYSLFEGLLWSAQIQSAERQILVKDFNKFHDRFIPMLDKSLSSGRRLEAEKAGIVAARGAYWGSLRAGMQPMFHNDHLVTYAQVINQAVDDLIRSLQSVANIGEQVDIHRQLGRMTMQVIGAAAFGVEFKTQKAAAGDDIPLVKAAQAFFENSKPSFWNLLAFVAPRSFLPVLKLLSRTIPSKVLTLKEDSVDAVYRASDCLIENARKQYFKDSKEPVPWKWFKDDPQNPYKDAIPAENSVIPMLLKANNKATGTTLTHMQIAAQTSIMMLAGYETTASTLAFSVYLLGKHPHAQHRLLQEVDAFKGPLGYDSLSEFPYTAAIINEALRLYPPFSILLREATDDVQLGKYHVPKGTPVHISLWSMHRDERYWQDAEVFKPERWLGDKTGGDKSGGMAYNPFGTGPRMCIGIKLALEKPSLHWCDCTRLTLFS